MGVMKTLHAERRGKHPRVGERVQLIGKAATRYGSAMGRLIRIRPSRRNPSFVCYVVALDDGREVVAANYDLDWAQRRVCVPR